MHLQSFVPMQESTPMGFLDVTVLLEASHPRPRLPWVWLAMASCVILVIVALVASQDAGSAALEIGASFLSGLIFCAMVILLRFTLHGMRMDQQSVASVGEMIHLRRWPEAAVSLQNILSQPAKTFQLRTEALLYLAAVLARYHRF